MQNVSKIQTNMDSIIESAGGYIPTIDECNMYFISEKYEGAKPGSEKLAELCRLCGVLEHTFKKYQDIYEEQKERVEDIAPQSETRTYRIYSVDDPKALLVGANEFSECCQRLCVDGEECMKNRLTPEIGRIIEIFDNDGSQIAQSWMWRNGNDICFDSIEVDATNDRTRYTSDERKRLKAKIMKAYSEAIKDLVEKTREEIKKFKNVKLKEIEQMDISDGERKKKLSELDKICDDSMIKKVTAGSGFWQISSEIAKTGVLYEEERRFIKDDGENIGVDTIKGTKKSKNEARKEDVSKGGEIE